jgi:hypothetical protein
MALMENMDTLNQHQKEVAQSAGSAKKMMDEAYNQSLDARIQDLKRAFEQLYEKITSSEQLKWLVSEFTQLVTALTNVDGQTIAFTATIGGLVLVMSKLSTLNKTLIAGEAVTGLSKFIAVLTGMSTVSTTINEVTNATKAMQLAQMGAIAQTEGLTGLKGAWVLLSTGIKEAVASSVAFMTTPLGLIISGIAVAVGIAITAFTSYKEHQAELTQQSNTLKEALKGVNEALKNGDTSKAQEDVDKMKKAQEQLQRLIEIKKKYQDMPTTSFNPTAGGANQADLIAGVNKKIEEQEKVLKDAGYTIDETTGKVNEFTEAQDKIDNTKVINSIKEQTKAQLENRQNMEQAQTEFNNYISSVQSLYSEYQNLSAQESLSAEQKTQLGNVVEQLQEKVGGLNVSIDENGKAYISNSPLIEANIQRLQSEGLTVDNLSAIRITDAKVNSEWQVGNSQVTYAEITNRIGMYKAEIQAIQAVISARMAGAQDYSTMSIGKAQSLEENSPEFEQLKQQQDQLHAYEKAKQQADSLYAGIGSVPYSGGNGGNIPSSASGDYMPSGGDSKKKKEKENKELEDSEKQMIKDITDAYNEAKDKIENDIGEIDYNLKLLGDTDDSNFVQKVDLTSKKMNEQKQIVSEAETQLNKLKSTTVTTAEAQKELESATLKASKELRDEKLEVANLQEQIDKFNTDELKKMFDNQKEIEEATLESQQKKQTKDLEDLENQQEQLHQSKMDNYEAELNALEKQHNEEEKSNELQEKKNDLKQKEIELNNLENQKTVKYAKENADHTFSYVGAIDQETVDKKKKEVDDAKKAYNKEKSDQEYDKEKQKIEDSKTAEDKAYNVKKEYLKKISDDLKETQDRDKKRIESYYSDTERMAKTMLGSLKKEYNDNISDISNAISIFVNQSTQKLNNLKTLQANFTSTEQDEAINSGDVSGYLNKNKDKLNDKANLDVKGITNYLNSVDSGAKIANKSISDLSDSYEKLAVSKKNVDITDDDIKDRKTQVDKITKTDSDGLSEQYKNLVDINNKLESEQDAHYKNELDKQNKSQTDEYNSRVQFADKFTKFEDKFLELVQMVWDFRFGNIVNITQSSMGYVMEALVQCEEAFQDFRNMMDKMGVNIGDVDISDIQTKFNAYKQEISTWTEGKKGLYDNSNNPLYNQSVYDQYKNYANASGYSMNSSVLNSLSGSGAVSTVNNNKTASSVTYQFGDLTFPNVDSGVKDVFTDVITQAKQLALLKNPK